MVLKLKKERMLVDLLSLLHQAGLVSLLLHPAGLREQRRHHEAASSPQVREVCRVSVLLESMVSVNSRCLNNSQFHSYRCALSTNWPRRDTGTTWFQFFLTFNALLCLQPPPWEKQQHREPSGERGHASARPRLRHSHSNVCTKHRHAAQATASLQRRGARLPAGTDAAERPNINPQITT